MSAQGVALVLATFRNAPSRISKRSHQIKNQYCQHKHHRHVVVAGANVANSSRLPRAVLHDDDDEHQFSQHPHGNNMLALQPSSQLNNNNDPTSFAYNGLDCCDSKIQLTKATGIHLNYDMHNHHQHHHHNGTIVDLKNRLCGRKSSASASSLYLPLTVGTWHSPLDQRHIAQRQHRHFSSSRQRKSSSLTKKQPKKESDSSSDGEKERKKSQIEKVVERIRQKREEHDRFIGYGSVDEDLVEVKPPWIKQAMEKQYWIDMWGKVKYAVHHTKMGFILLWTDTKVGSGLLRRVIQGEVLSRRERNQLVRTATDLFRLVPFSVFILVPFGELALPFAIKIFPGLLPTQFRDKKDVTSKRQGQLSVKIDMARFLQETVENMALEKAELGSEKNESDVAEFITLLDKGRDPNVHVPTADILKFTSLFEDVVTLDYLSRDQLRAICKLLTLNSYGSNAFLALQIRMKLRELHADDLLIQAEGVINLSETELQAACRERGMRALGVSVDELRFRLEQWLTLHLRERVPASLLLLTRLLYLPKYQNLNASEQLAAAIESLPESAKLEVKLAAVEAETGPSSFEDKLEIITEQQQLIEEEREIKKKKQEEVVKAKELKKLLQLEQAQQDHDHPFVCNHEPQCAPDVDFEKIEAKIKGLDMDSESEAAALQELKEKEESRKEELMMLEEEGQGKIVVPTGAVNLSKQIEKMLINLQESVAESEQIKIDSQHTDAEPNQDQDQLEQALLEQDQDQDQLPRLRHDFTLEDVVDVTLGDVDENGIVTTDELSNALKSLAFSVKDENMIDDLVKKLDADEDGIIDVEKLAQVWKVLRDVSIEQGKELEALTAAANAFEKEELVSLQSTPSLVSNLSTIFDKTIDEK